LVFFSAAAPVNLVLATAADFFSAALFCTSQRNLSTFFPAALVVPREFTERTDGAIKAAVGAPFNYYSLAMDEDEEEEKEKKAVAAFFDHVFDQDVRKTAANAHDVFSNQGIAAEKKKVNGEEQKGRYGGGAAGKKKLKVAAAEEKKKSAEKKSAAVAKTEQGTAAEKKQAKHVVENVFADL
jgi:hypothetical protein